MVRSLVAALAVFAGLTACASGRQHLVAAGEAQSDPAEWTSWQDAGRAPPLSGSIGSSAPELRASSHRARAPDPAEPSAPPLADLDALEDEELAFEELPSAYEDDEDDQGDQAPASETAAAVARGSAVTGEPTPAAGTAKKAGARAKAQRKTSVGTRIARTAARWVGLRSLRTVSKKVPDDCSGLIRAAYGRHGIDVMNSYALPGDNAVTIIWRRAKWAGALRKRSPRPGDLVFFKETYDRNRDGRRNDGLTHIGIVEKVERDGTVTFIHRGGQGVVRARMNTAHARQRMRADGRVYNDYLRVPDGTTAPRLSGELFVAYASPKAFLGDPRVARRR